MSSPNTAQAAKFSRVRTVLQPQWAGRDQTTVQLRESTVQTAVIDCGNRLKSLSCRSDPDASGFPVPGLVCVPMSAAAQPSQSSAHD